ncbi:MAG: YcbK family protein [Elusimicrobia bacterium]|nr:YcbK family protein [Elusimicrobiota bacterium]
MLALTALALLIATPSQAASRLQLPESALSIRWDGAAAQRFAPDDRIEALIKSVKPVAVVADVDDDEGPEAEDVMEAEADDYQAQGLGGLGDGRLGLHSPHFGERIEVTYRTADGRYDQAALANIRHLFRCKLTGETVEIPIGLIELLDAIQDHFGADVIELICGYRSAERNERMRKKSSGVAKNSLHVKGWAADIHVPGAALAKLRDFAMSLKAGGVGYYPSSGFVHVDVGRVRYW